MATDVSGARRGDIPADTSAISTIVHQFCFDQPGVLVLHREQNRERGRSSVKGYALRVSAPPDARICVATNVARNGRRQHELESAILKRVAKKRDRCIGKRARLEKMSDVSRRWACRPRGLGADCNPLAHVVCRTFHIGYK